ncbi:hypothetical protein AAFC00_007238 [Neodothiora populina]
MVPILAIFIISIIAIFFPSYTHPPAHYTTLRERVLAASQAGQANLDNEKIYIAAAVPFPQAELPNGPWGTQLLDLVRILGPDNVFLSVYINEPGHYSDKNLIDFAKSVNCSSSVVTEHVDTSTIAHVTTSSGKQRLKRAAYMSEIRNRALRPLEDAQSIAHRTRFDKFLFIDDIAFDPIDAANLIFSTNINSKTGKATYHATCAMEFVNSFEFSNAFATRDIEGYPIGLPAFPWFSYTGEASSRADIVAQRDAVRVRSCWGGLVAFEGRWFQHNGVDESMPPPDSANDHNGTVMSPSTLASNTPTTITGVKSTSSSVVDYHPDVDMNLNWHLDTDTSTQKLHRHIPAVPSRPTSPVRFRVSTDTYWEASECCLALADLAFRVGDENNKKEAGEAEDSGIYMNPYIRVAPDRQTLEHLRFARRFERVSIPFHRIHDWLAGNPQHNPRRLQEVGEEVTDRLWTFKDDDWMHTGNLRGRFESVKRTAQPGGFCGERRLMALDERAVDQSVDRWWDEEVPPDNGQ